MTNVKQVAAKALRRVFFLWLVAAVLGTVPTSLRSSPKLPGTAAARTSQASAPRSSNKKPADFVLTNGKIYTEDASRSTVEALAVRDGKIVFAGGDAEAAGFIGAKTTVEDAGGRLVLPGLIDIHIHPIGIVDFGGCDLQAKPHTLAEIGTIVRGCIERMHVPAGHWVAVSQWEYAAGNESDPEHLTLRAALDAASTQNPIVMTGWDGHHGAYNSAALALARNAKAEVVGYSKKTLETDFAQYKEMVGVDSNGEPNGYVQDDGKLPMDSSEAGREDFQKLLQEPEKLAQRLSSDGLTAIQDALAISSARGPLGSGNIYDVYDKLFQKGDLTFRLNACQFWLPENFRDAQGHIDWDALFAKANAVRQKYASNPLIRADCVKVVADGDVESDPSSDPPTFGDSPRPVPYLQPIFGRDANGYLTVKGYVDLGSPVCDWVRAKPMDYSTPQEIADFIKMYGYHPGQCAVDYGVPQHAPAIFFEYIKRAHLADYTVHVHAISDLAVHTAVEGLEAARQADGNYSRPDTIAHIQCGTPEDVARIGNDRLYIAFTYRWMYAEPHGYDMSMVPFFDKVSGNSYEALHNPNNYYEKCVYPAKTAKDAGAIIAAGSDAPVLNKDPQPFVNMEMGVTRARHGIPPISPWQRLNVRDVIDAYTINGAAALNRASEIGSIEAGKSADFIIVDQNILALADGGHPEKIGETKVLETWFMGKKVYSAPKE
jgi:predicted amidohydrolase YtcJ